MAVAMRSSVGDLADGWRTQGHVLGFGVGIAQGYATLGRVGFEGRYDYAAIGTVTNLAARLCEAARDARFWSASACTRLWRSSSRRKRCTRSRRRASAAGERAQVVGLVDAP